MRYLIEHHETFYYRRKLQYQNICLSLKTKNKVEAKYILDIINSKIELLRCHMDFYEELKYIKEIIKHYVDVAKNEYSEFATKRDKKYVFIKPNGKKLSGSHPIAIENAIEELTDDLYSAEKNEIVEQIVEDSNIKKEFAQALQTLSKENQQRLRDEIIKAEIELLYFDKQRNENRVKEDKLQNTYIEARKAPQQNTFSNALEIIAEIDKQDKDKFRLKTKNELYDEYVELMKEQKPNEMDKISLALKTLLLSSEAEYFIECQRRS